MYPANDPGTQQTIQVPTNDSSTQQTIQVTIERCLPDNPVNVQQTIQVELPSFSVEFQELEK